MTSSLKSIPSPKQHWLKGSLGQFDATKVHNFFYSTARQLSGVARIRFLHKTMVIFQNSETIQQLLKNRPARFRRAKVIEDIFTEIGINGVFSAEGSDWKKQRHLMNPAFRPSQIKLFYPHIQTITQRLSDRLADEHDSIDIQSLLMSYTVDITSTLAFGKDVNTLQNSDAHLIENLNVIFPMISFRLRAPFPYWRWFSLQRDKDLDESFLVVKSYVIGFIESAKNTIEARGYTSVDQAENLLESMLLSKDEHGDGYSEQEVFTNVITLLLAGEDTTANTLAWILDYLADRPDLQDALYHEIVGQIPQGQDVSFEQLPNFSLVSGVIHEAMRLKPVAPHLYLEPIHDEVIEGYEIPAGTTIVALLGGDGFDESLFPNAESFDPFRWLDIDDKTRKDYSSRLMPFGYGARLCPGRQLSMVEMRYAVIKLISRFRFERSEKSKPADEIIKFTLQPLGLRVNCIER
ncbi:MAG: cytochrome P450 [Flavobacteriales bacterium]|jgi:cytochrome P450